MDNTINELVGKTIKKIYFNENNLKFETDNGNFCFMVLGDCCSSSYFYDFYGVKNLLRGNPVLRVEKVDLLPSDIVKDKYGYDIDKKGSDSISVYGYRLTTLDKELGEVSSVFSFRNYSNGYYGGWMESCEDQDVSPEITEDVIESAK